MRLWTYIKSRNETFLTVIILGVIIISSIVWFNGDTTEKKDISVPEQEDNSVVDKTTLKNKKMNYLISTSTTNIQGYTIEFIHKYAEDKPVDSWDSWDNIRILKNGEVLFETDSIGRFLDYNDNWITDAEDIKPKALQDINGNGIPELILQEYSGGFHCCSQNYIIELSDPISFLLDLDTGNQIIVFEDLNHDGMMEVETSEDVFSYWYTSYGSSPRPKVVLSIQDGVYKANPALMRKPAPTDAVLRKKASTIESWSSVTGPEVAWVYAIDLIYSGNINSAKKYVDLTWRNDKYGAFKTRESFWGELVDRIVQSPYFSDLSSFLGFEDMILYSNVSSRQKVDITGRVVDWMTYGRILVKNSDSDYPFMYFIAEPDDVITEGASRYSPTINAIKNEAVIEIIGEVIDGCFWNDEKYDGCVPWVTIKSLQQI